MSNPYQAHNCSCGEQAVGMATNFKQTKYYCNRHYWGMSKRVDDWLAVQERKQWGYQEWFVKGTETPTPKKVYRKSVVKPTDLTKLTPQQLQL